MAPCHETGTRVRSAQQPFRTAKRSRQWHMHVFTVDMLTATQPPSCVPYQGLQPQEEGAGAVFSLPLSPFASVWYFLHCSANCLLRECNQVWLAAKIQSHFAFFFCPRTCLCSPKPVPFSSRFYLRKARAAMHCKQNALTAECVFRKSRGKRTMARFEHNTHDKQHPMSRRTGRAQQQPNE
jgi:hypothetical protein